MKMSSKFFDVAESFAESYGYRNVQDLALDSLREKIFEKPDFDESFSEKEIDLIDSLVEKSVKKKRFVSEEELFRALQ